MFHSIMFSSFMFSSLMFSFLVFRSFMFSSFMFSSFRCRILLVLRFFKTTLKFSSSPVLVLVLSFLTKCLVSLSLPPATVVERLRTSVLLVFHVSVFPGFRATVLPDYLLDLTLVANLDLILLHVRLLGVQLLHVRLLHVQLLNVQLLPVQLLYVLLLHVQLLNIQLLHVQLLHVQLLQG